MGFISYTKWVTFRRRSGPHFLDEMRLISCMEKQFLSSAPSDCQEPTEACIKFDFAY